MAVPPAQHEEPANATSRCSPFSLSPSGDGTVSLIYYLEAARAADAALNQERDRRYKEVAEEREKALQIKSAADDKALELARQIHDLKEEQSTRLREQISSGLYVTRGDMEIMVRPLVEFMRSQQGGATAVYGARERSRLNVGTVLAVISVIGVVTNLVVYLIAHH